jgi:hypothetical protein
LPVINLSEDCQCKISAKIASEISQQKLPVSTLSDDCQ